MPSGPVRKPEIERPGLNGSAAVSAPWKISTRLPSGSASTIRSFTRRSSASAREPRATFTPAASSFAAERIERGGIRHLPAEEADARAAVLIDDDALLAVVHAEREARRALVDALQAEQLRAVVAPIVERLRANADITQ